MRGFVQSLVDWMVVYLTEWCAHTHPHCNVRMHVSTKLYRCWHISNYSLILIFLWGGGFPSYVCTCTSILIVTCRWTFDTLYHEAIAGHLTWCWLPCTNKNNATLDNGVIGTKSPKLCLLCEIIYDVFKQNELNEWLSESEVNRHKSSTLTSIKSSGI